MVFVFWPMRSHSCQTEVMLSESESRADIASCKLIYSVCVCVCWWSRWGESGRSHAWFPGPGWCSRDLKPLLIRSRRISMGPPAETLMSMLSICQCKESRELQVYRFAYPSNFYHDDIVIFCHSWIVLISYYFYILSFNLNFSLRFNCNFYIYFCIILFKYFTFSYLVLKARKHCLSNYILFLHLLCAFEFSFYIYIFLIVALKLILLFSVSCQGRIYIYFQLYFINSKWFLVVLVNNSSGGQNIDFNIGHLSCQILSSVGVYSK